MGGVLVLVTYFGLAWGLGSWATNRDFVPVQDGVEVFVRSNGAHTDVVLPREEWGDWFPDEHFLDVPPSASYVAVGWGHKETYLNVATWGDLTPDVALRALFWQGETVTHVAVLDKPQVGENCRSVRISEPQLRSLEEFVRGTFALDESGQPIQVPDAHYHQQDAFYNAKPSYSFLNTCNVWTGDALRQAGIRTGAWTPLPGAVLEHLD